MVNASKSTPTEIVADSEGEKPETSQKKDSSDAENASGDEGDQEEYEIEAILDAKHGAFAGGKLGYLVKWKGYPDEHNSWVNADDAAGAAEMIDEYWKKQKRNKKSRAKQSRGRLSKSEGKDGSPEVDEPSSQNKRKKGTAVRKSKSSQREEATDEEDEERPMSKKSKKRLHAESEEMDIDPKEDGDHDEYQPMNAKKYSEKSWEKLVQHVDTIEKMDGVLKVFFTLNTGEKVVEPSSVCAKHFPQKLIQFYESNLRWREAE